jgi:uncharacterized damage-inducible protein DinB
MLYRCRAASSHYTVAARTIDGMESHPGSTRAAALASALDVAAGNLIAAIESIDPETWARVPAPGVWSVGKDVDHVIEAIAFHRWIVELTIGRAKASKRPRLERKELTSALSPAEAAREVQRGTEVSRGVILALTDEQLALTTKPPRAGSPPLATTIERMLINHYDTHRADIEAKLGG